MATQKKPTKRGRTWRRRLRSGRQQIARRAARPQQDHSDEILDLLRFLKSRGFRNTKHLQVAQFGTDYGRGILAAKQAVTTDQTGPNKYSCLVSLPLNCVIMPSVLRAQFPQLYGKLNIDDDVLIVFLMHERSNIDRGLGSEWSPYINALPRQYDLPFLRDFDFSSHVPTSFSSFLLVLCNAILVCNF